MSEDRMVVIPRVMNLCSLLGYASRRGRVRAGGAARVAGTGGGAARGAAGRAQEEGAQELGRRRNNRGKTLLLLDPI